MAGGCHFELGLFNDILSGGTQPLYMELFTHCTEKEYENKSSNAELSCLLSAPKTVAFKFVLPGCAHDIELTHISRQ